MRHRKRKNSELVRDLSKYHPHARVDIVQNLENHLQKHAARQQQHRVPDIITGNQTKVSPSQSPPLLTPQ